MKKQIKLNLGCGVSIVKGFINIDKFYTEKQIRSKKGYFKTARVAKGGTFVQADMCALPFKDGYADYIEAVDSVEHVSHRHIQLAFNEMYRVLKKRGKLVIMTTNFDQLAQMWLETVAGKPLNEPKTQSQYLNLMQIIYGNQLYAGEYHTTPLNPYFLGYLLNQAGFRNDKIRMTVYPKDTQAPLGKLQTTNFKKGNTVRSEMIVVEATK